MAQSPVVQRQLTVAHGEERARRLPRGAPARGTTLGPLRAALALACGLRARVQCTRTVEDPRYNLSILWVPGYCRLLLEERRGRASPCPSATQPNSTRDSARVVATWIRVMTTSPAVGAWARSGGLETTTPYVGE